MKLAYFSFDAGHFYGHINTRRYAIIAGVKYVFRNILSHAGACLRRCNVVLIVRLNIWKHPLLITSHSAWCRKFVKGFRAQRGIMWVRYTRVACRFFLLLYISFPLNANQAWDNPIVKDAFVFWYFSVVVSVQLMGTLRLLRESGCIFFGRLNYSQRLFAKDLCVRRCIPQSSSFMWCFLPRRCREDQDPRSWFRPHNAFYSYLRLSTSVQKGQSGVFWDQYLLILG